MVRPGGVALEVPLHLERVTALVLPISPSPIPSVVRMVICSGCVPLKLPLHFESVSTPVLPVPPAPVLAVVAVVVRARGVPLELPLHLEGVRPAVLPVPPAPAPDGDVLPVDAVRHRHVQLSLQPEVVPLPSGLLRPVGHVGGGGRPPVDVVALVVAVVAALQAQGGAGAGGALARGALALGLVGIV